MAMISSAGFLQSIRAFASRSDFGLELLAQARARKAIVEKAKTPPYSSRTSAIITALRFPRDYATIIKAANVEYPQICGG
jgi:hypothetical protein